MPAVTVNLTDDLSAEGIGTFDFVEIPRTGEWIVIPNNGPAGGSPSYEVLQVYHLVGVNAEGRAKILVQQK
jgi:hypothetical protein